ncbi:zinc ribbon domain-containing protein [Saccharopolyspora sp. NPDC047091]|uniref:zinc ribbon domain-containing protein n=1 Tax=Saccharopolyspora sp. NPDC047091 TaxID=3155924 RepID=UPI0033EEB04B
MAPITRSQAASTPEPCGGADDLDEGESSSVVTEEGCVAVQSVRAVRKTGDDAVRADALSGLVRCGVCGRRMDSHWINHRPGFRDRHGHTSTRQRAADQPKSLLRPEDRLSDWLTAQLGNESSSVGAARLREAGQTITCSAET